MKIPLGIKIQFLIVVPISLFNMVLSEVYGSYNLNVLVSIGAIVATIVTSCMVWKEVRGGAPHN